MNSGEFDYVKTFPPLGNPEHHFNRYPEHPWLKTKSEVEDWLNFYSENEQGRKMKFIIHEDLTVSCSGEGFTFYLNILNEGCIPIQFREVKKFHISNKKLVSLIGTPYVSDVVVACDNKVKNFIGLSKNIKRKIDLTYNKGISFEGMPCFLNKVLLDMEGSQIKSWDGFNKDSKEVSIYFYDHSMNEKDFYDFILESPENIVKILVDHKNRFLIFSNNNGLLDMDWLNKERKLIKNALETKEKLEKLDSNDLIAINKRKI